MISNWEVIETNHMIEKENLDVRTITIGISLLDCIDSNLDKLKATTEVIESMIDDFSSIVTILYGKDVTEEEYADFYK